MSSSDFAGLFLFGLLAFTLGIKVIRMVTRMVVSAVTSSQPYPPAPYIPTPQAMPPPSQLHLHPDDARAVLAAQEMAGEMAELRSRVQALEAQVSKLHADRDTRDRWVREAARMATPGSAA